MPLQCPLTMVYTGTGRVFMTGFRPRSRYRCTILIKDQNVTGFLFKISPFGIFH